MASFDKFIKTFNPDSNDKGKQFEQFVKTFAKKCQVICFVEHFETQEILDVIPLIHSSS